MKDEERKQYRRYCLVKTESENIDSVFTNINKGIIELYEIKPFVFKFLKLCEKLPFLTIYGQYEDMPYRLVYYRGFSPIQPFCEKYIKIDILYEQKFFEEL